MIITGGREELEIAAASRLARIVERFLAKQDTVVFGTVGGTSVAPVLQGLGQVSGSLDRLQLFLVDERLVPADDEASNYRLAASCLDRIVPAENLHPYTHHPDDPNRGIAEYRSELSAYGGTFDIVLLSSGEDGHVGSLFPHHHTIRATDDFFVLTDSAPKPPPGRMSASKRLIGRSRTGLLLFFGAGKRDAYVSFEDDRLDVEACPAKVVSGIPDHYVFVDRSDQP